MATLDVNFYDYNGYLYAFGIINGYTTVNSVRMYVSDGNGTTYQYCSSQIYDKNTARINTSAYGTPSFVFNIRTDRDLETGSPMQLDYNVIDPDDSSGRGRYKVSFHFYSSSDGTGSPLNSSVLTPSANGNSNVWYQMHNSLSAPSISYDDTNKKIKLSNVGNHRYMIEVRKKNRVDTGFKVRVRDYAYTVLMKGLEGTVGGKYTEAVNMWQYDWNNPIQTCRYVSPWENGWNQKAIVIFDSGAGFSDSNKENYLSIAQSAFNEICEIINSVIGGTFTISVESMTSSLYSSDANATVDTYIDTYGAYRSNDYNYNFIVRIGNDYTMKLNDGSFQGFWSCYAWTNYPEWGVSCSMANINVDASKNNESISHVIHEEIYQSFNIGADNFEQPLSIHYDPQFPNPDTYYLSDPYDDDNLMWDKEVLKFCYSQDMNGWTPIDFINNVDTPCCLLQDTKASSGYYEFDLSGLNSGEYIIYGWVADEGSYEPGGGTWSSTASHYNWDGGWDDSHYSIKNSINISISGGKPEKWVWSSRIRSEVTLPCDSNGIHPISAVEWNNFTKRINEFRNYAGYNDYNFTIVSSNTPLTASIYNEAVAAIKGVSGYGSYVYYVDNTTTMIENTNFKRSLFDSLANEANAIAGYV